MRTGVAAGPSSRPSGRAIAALLLGMAGLAACITLEFLGMRVVMDVGGFCAEGGAYEIATHCPAGTVVIVPLGMFGLLASVGLAMAGASAVGGAYQALPALAWPSLFLSLGWNFLEYGLNPPGGGGWAWDWLICGVIFWMMGGIPLLIGAMIFRASFRARRNELARNRLRAGPSAPAPPSYPADALAPPTGPAAGSPPWGDAMPTTTAANPPGDLVDDLERLARLRADGALDDAEFEAAKDRLLGREGRS